MPGRFILGAIYLILILSVCSPAQEKNKRSSALMHLFFGKGAERWDSETEAWTDSKMMAQFSKLNVDDDYIQALYKEFRQAVVLPAGKVDLRKRLGQIVYLGKKVHNLKLALAPDKLSRYGDLLSVMQDILYLDAQHIAEALNSNSKKVYFYTLDKGWLEYLEKESKSLFGKK